MVAKKKKPTKKTTRKKTSPKRKKQEMPAVVLIMPADRASQFLQASREYLGAQVDRDVQHLVGQVRLQLAAADISKPAPADPTELVKTLEEHVKKLKKQLTRKGPAAAKGG